MSRHLAIAGGIALVGASVLYWMSLGGSTAVEGVDAAPASDSRKVTTFEAGPSADPSSDDAAKSDAPEDEAAAADGPNAPRVPSDPKWAEVHGRFRQVMGGRIQVVVPDDATDAEAHELQMDAIDAREDDLDALIVELTDLAETTTDEPTRLDALVSLGEVYLEQANNTADTPIPDWVKPRRVRRIEDDIANRTAIAEDKARMVLEMARGSESGLSAELAARIAAGLEAL